MMLIRNYSPWRCPLLMLLGVIVGGGGMYGAQLLLLQQSQQENLSLQQKLTANAGMQQVDKQALNEVQHGLSECQLEMREAKEELNFYRKLAGMNPENRQEEILIKNISLSPDTPAPQYFFKLVLTQLAKDAKISKGKLELVVTGTEHGKTKRLNSADLKIDPNNLNFKFKHFQRLEGTLQLPAEFVPQKLGVSLPSTPEKKAVESSFEWKALQQTKE